MKVWTLVADRASAKIFESKSLVAPLTFKESYENPEGRLKEQELVTDKLGATGNGTGYGNGSRISSNDGATEHVLDLFVKDVAEHLRVAHTRNDFDTLRLIANPHVLGKLRASLDQQVANSIVLELNKNLIQQNEQSILAALQTAGESSKPGQATAT